MTNSAQDDLLEEMDEFDSSNSVEEDHSYDQLSKEFVEDLIEKIFQFMAVLVGHPLHPYQEPFGKRIVESVLINDGEEVTGLASRQSGKTETVSDVVAALMILLPRLARIYPDLLGQFKDGLWVGMFAPVEGQVETMFQRTISRLTSERAVEIMGDPEIDDQTKRVGGVVKTVKLAKSGSFVSMMTANPRAKIESKTFHLIIIDEAQEADDFVVAKSIAPMLAYHAGTMVKSGTPTTRKNNFYRSIQLNRRRQTAKKGAKQNHFQWDWKDVAKINPNYERFIRKEMLRIGEDSDEFQMSYNCRWILERGMFTNQKMMDELGDTSMNFVKSWTQTPVVVGIDPARKTDSTVVTVVWVDWDRPDEYGFYDHRVLNWLEIQGDDWEEQYAKIVDFLSTYNVLGVAVDANGVGDAVAQRLRLLLPRAEVHSITSSQVEQSRRYKHLMAVMERHLLGWPAHANARRTRLWRKFQQQMLDAEKHYKGPHFSVKAPDEAWAHDDFVDSLALGVALTADLAMPTVEVATNPFFS
jgi:Terminase large subunit, T4likevirus-type, N-terminal/Terminase RNaseH-like domain